MPDLFSPYDLAIAPEVIMSLYLYLAGSVTFAAGSAVSLLNAPTGRLNLWLYLVGSLLFVAGSALAIARS